MPAKLDKGEDTVKIGLKLPKSLKDKVEAMAADDGGSVSKLLRVLISRAWDVFAKRGTKK